MEIESKAKELAEEIRGIVQQRSSLIHLCGEILATLSLEKNMEYTIGCERFRELVEQWRERFDSIKNKPDKE